jgi:hypothetical protein
MRYEVTIELGGSATLRAALHAEVVAAGAGGPRLGGPMWGPMTHATAHGWLPSQPYEEGQVEWRLDGDADGAWEAQEQALARLDAMVTAFDVRAAFADAHQLAIRVQAMP